MGIDVGDFEAQVVEASREVPVLVDFWAAWCGPCRILGPVLERLAEESEGRWRLAKVDVELQPEVAARYGVAGIPNVQLFVDGVPVDGFVGAHPEPEIRRWLARIVPGDAQREARRLLGQAREHIREGRTEAARGVLEEVLAEAPDDPEARLELARLVVFAEPDRADDLLEGVALPGRSREIAVALRSFADLARRADAPGSLGESPAGSRYLDAIRHLRGHEVEAALQDFIAALREDRYLDDDGPRKACVAIFQYLGQDDPIVVRYRGELGNALYG